MLIYLRAVINLCKLSSILLKVRANIFVANKKRDIRMEYVNPTLMSFLVNLVISSDGNDIGVRLT